MTRRRAFGSLLLVLGGGVFVVAAVAAVRVLVRGRGGVTVPEPLPALPAPGGDEVGPGWVQMPPGSVPIVEPPPVTQAEQVLPHARDAEEVVERLVPADLQGGPVRRRLRQAWSGVGNRLNVRRRG